MKKHATLRLFLLLTPVLALCCSMMGCASSGRGAPGSVDQSSFWHESEGIVRGIEGQAEISRDGQRWESLRNGQIVEEGDRLRTSAGSSVRLDLGEHGGGIVRIMPDSQVHFEQLGASHTDSDVLAIMNLQQGRVTGDTLKMPLKHKIVVKTPTETYEIR